jgi:hypothetical protein
LRAIAVGSTGAARILASLARWLAAAARLFRRLAGRFEPRDKTGNQAGSLDNSAHRLGGRCLGHDTGYGGNYLVGLGCRKVGFCNHVLLWHGNLVADPCILWQLHGVVTYSANAVVGRLVVWIGDQDEFYAMRFFLLDNPVPLFVEQVSGNLHRQLCDDLGGALLASILAYES